jgi:membrane-bound lytic murein transglycosylase A
LRRRLFSVLGLAAALAACVAIPRTTFETVAIESLPGWNEDDQAQALPAIVASCERFRHLGASAIGPNGIAGTPRDWLSVCAVAARLADRDKETTRRFIAEQFRAYRVGPGDGLFTGYFEPVVRGSRLASAKFSAPIYRAPPELRRGSQFLSRAEIEAGALAARGLEIVWLEDPFDAFVIQVQGSGRVQLSEGGEVRLRYAADNGHAYVAIGRVLADEGRIPREGVTLASIRSWVASNREAGRSLMQRNPRFIFFSEAAAGAPVGSLGVGLTAGRSLAVDPEHMPLGAPLWIETTHPLNGAPLRRLVVAQDTGAAIKGAVRGDLFWGGGPEAEAAAGEMRGRGNYYLLLPKQVRAPG